MFKHKLIITLLGACYSTWCLAATPPNDPMRPPGEDVASPRAGGTATPSTRSLSNGYHLSAIRITKDQRSATINGKSITIGERIGTATLVEIRTSSVILKQDGKVQSIPLLPLSIKKPVEAHKP